VRLGLVEAAYDKKIAGTDSYDWVEDRPEYKRLTEAIAATVNTAQPPEPADYVGYDKGFLRRTAFGERFATAVSIVASPLGR
jgi:hypothetical protein